MSLLNRFRRRSVMVGGPLHGTSQPIPLPEDHRDPPFRCHKPAGGTWHHYIRKSDGRYHYDGACTRQNHFGTPLPHEHFGPCDS